MHALVKTSNGWALDCAATPEAAEVRGLFGTTVLPLPLGDACSREHALEFARGTETGKRYGVR